MSHQQFEKRQQLPVSAADAFAWHERPGALERLIPPWEKVELVRKVGEGVRTGTRVTLKNRFGPFQLTWEAEHREYVPGRLFRDVALRGPFAYWDHRHEFTDTGEGECLLRDSVEYELPGGMVGRMIAGGLVRRKMAALFRYRQSVTHDDLAFFQSHSSRTPLRILVSGASGFVGRALCPFLTTQGHEVLHLVRRAPRSASEAYWDWEKGEIDLSKLGQIDAVVHLAGAGIADARWTEARRRVIRDSRVVGTRLLAEALARLPSPPRVVVGGSAIGYYGSQGDAMLDESTGLGNGFLAEVGAAWEGAWEPLSQRNVRLVYLRTGVVLSPQGGALAKLLPAFRFGVGGPVGHGRHWWSWISMDDVLGAIGHALENGQVSGPLNAVAPEPVTSAEFARVLGCVLGRPAFLPAPAWALRMALGPMVDEVLLASQRVRPAKLIGTGYKFRHSTLESALRHLLGCDY